MATVAISPTLNEVVSAVSVTALTRSDTGLTPSGVSLPIALSADSETNGLYPWSGTFTDTNPPASYNAILAVTFASGAVVSTAYTVQYGAANLSGIYWTQVGVQAVFGSYNIAVWSQKQNDTSSLDPVAIQSAGDRTDRAINRILIDHNYSAPLSSSSRDFGDFQDAGNLMVAVKLYQGRPGTDTGTTMDGAMADAAKQAENMLRSMVRSSAGIDCPRLASPAVMAANPQRSAARQGYPVPVRPAIPAIRPWWGIGGWW